MKRKVILQETYKRLKTAEKLAKVIIPSKAVLLAGSVAYAPDYSVTPKSDLELICIIENQDALRNLFIEKTAARHLSSGNADLYKTNLSGYEFPVNLIFWTSPFFERVCNDINFEFGVRFSKENLSGKKIQLCGLHGQRVIFTRKSTKTNGGYLTKYPVHQIKHDLYYYAGVPVENLLSNPQVFEGDKEYVNKHIHTFWSIIAERCRNEYGGPDDDPFIENLLLRRNRMSLSFLDSLMEKEDYYWHLARNHQFHT